jgi:hypothetical protein
MGAEAALGPLESSGSAASPDMPWWHALVWMARSDSVYVLSGSRRNRSSSGKTARQMTMLAASQANATPPIP